MNSNASSSSNAWSPSSTPLSASCSDSDWSPLDHDNTVPRISVVEPIAIIGLSLKFPGDAVDEESFWKMMMEARSTASEFPKDRIQHAAHHSSDQGAMGTIRPQKGHFLKEDLAAFDTSFFGFTSAEASAMDPQQRGLLETTYRALENAGIPLNKIYGTDASVHTGCFTADYMMLMGKDPELMPRYTATGVAATMLSNRISAFYNLYGPSATIDTACSSSLVALDQACQSLQLGQSSMGIVAGCNLIFSLDLTIGLSNMGFLSPDGVCHSFDHRANGYARGEGFGVVIIKRLSDAVRDGDTVRAVIRATGTNQDGNTPLAQPNKDAQARLIMDTYRRAGLDPHETRYVEAHGTGTPVGDPLEATAIGTSFAAGRSRGEAIYVSSLKANFGHLEGAAGLAGLIKTVLVLERGIIPPLAGFDKVNPDIDVDFLNIKFPLTPTPWPSRGLRRASVNSFGFGGTNAHVVVDDAYHYMQQHGIMGKHATTISPPILMEMEKQPKQTSEHFVTPSIAQTAKPLVLAWSASDASTLDALTSEYKSWLCDAENTFMHADVLQTLACTLLERRSLLSWRSFATLHPLDCQDSLQISKPVQSRPNSELSLAFVFTGQGAQWCGMGKELFAYEVFRKSVTDAFVYLMGLGCYWHFAGAFTGEIEPPTRINEPGFAQPLCTILQVALCELLSSINVQPALVIGHSSGEIAAAFACGAISRKSAWKLAYFRGICSNKLAAMPLVQGAMTAVGLSEQEVQKHLDLITDEMGSGDLVVACVNSPSSVTVSGNKGHVEALISRLDQESIFARMLKVPVAYHSPHMEHVAGEYLSSIGTIEPGVASMRTYVNMVSSVTGERIEKESLLDPTYWVQNMVSQVKFAQAMQTAFAKPRGNLPNKLDLSHRNVLWATDIMEIGPHGALSGPIREILKPLPHGQEITYQPALTRKRDACVSLMSAVGHFYCRGYAAHLSKLNIITHQKSMLSLPNLPQYPFNHSKSFWYESRISKGMRFRQYARKAYLGTPVPDWNPADARWRHFLKAGDSSWIADHKINGRTIFPAAGMLTMAIEAASQLAGDTAISAFEISDTSFHSALDLPDVAEGVEVQLQLIAHHDTSTKHGLMYDWYLRMYQDAWVEVCRGTIRSVPALTSTNDVDSNNEEAHLSIRARNHFDAASQHCFMELDGSTLYQRLWKCGYHFGPAFKRIQTSKHSASGEAIAQVAIHEEQGIEDPTIIHPATLDGILQIMLPGITNGGNDSRFDTSLPTRINRIWISNTKQLRESASTVDVAVKIRKNGFRNTTSDIVALSQDRSLQVVVESIETTSITDGLEMSPEPHNSPPRLCWNIVHKPDLDRIDSEQLTEFLKQDAPDMAPSQQYHRDLSVVLYRFIKKANQKLTETGTPPLDGYLHKYYKWMQQQLGKPELAKALRAAESDMSFRSLYHDVKSQHPKFCKPYYRVGEHMASVLSGRSDPLSLLFKGSDMPDFYEYLLQRSNFMVPLERYLDLLTHRNPSVNILEVGAGTGGATKAIMKSLTQRGSSGLSPRYSRYCFTDVSPSFFSQAQSDLANFPKMDYKVLNLENDPLSQDFEPESFDLVIASLVLHATTSLDRTLEHLHTILKPGGKLIMIELTNPDSISAGFVFGTLPGWWLGNDIHRQNRLSPCLNPDEWNHVLKLNGFSGVDQVFWDTQHKEFRLNSLLISTKLDNNQPSIDRTISSAAIIQVDGCDEAQLRLCENHLKDLMIPVTRTDFVTLENTENLTETMIIIYDSPSQPVLHTFQERSFRSFRQTLLRASNVLWITPTNGSHTGPSAGSVYGLARTLRSEDSSLNFTIYEAESSSNAEKQRSNLHHIIAQCLSPSSDSFEPEVVEVNGMLQIPRVTEHVQLNEDISKSGQDMVLRDVRFKDANLRLTVKTPGLLDSLHFEQVSELSSALAPTEVEVRVKAVGVNFKDCLVALGRIPDNALGTECAGVVERVGSSCALQPGDKVVVSALDTYRSVVRCNQALVVKIPSDIPFVEAAKIPTNFITAYHALVEVGRISAGKSILIHAGAGGTGQAAIQVAQLFGAEVYVTVGSPHKKKLVNRTYGIPNDHIFYSRDTSFAQGIKQATSGRGVDLILNSLAGHELRASWECIAPYGHFLEIGKRDILAHEKLPMFQFAQNVSFSAIDIAAMTKERPDLIQTALKAVVDLLAEKKIHVALPLKVCSIHEVEDAFRHLQSGSSTGGVVVEIDQEAMLPALVSRKRKNCFRSDTTYLIAGGLGGQGVSIARWMVTNGARNLLILSRSGSSSNKATHFLQEMKALQVHVEAPSCDITNASTLRQVLDSVADRMPPIRGCIQAAMVIQDSLFASMTHSEWVTGLGPKVHGSWNLHSCLPQDLDFFIMLASTSGIIGSGGQANYAAGNTYQDALAAHRISRGQKAVSLDLSIMADEGYFTNHKDALEQYLSIKKLVPMTQDHLFTTLEHYCDPELSLQDMTSQVVMGLSLPADVRSKGEELASWMDRPFFSHLQQLASSTTVMSTEELPASSQTDLSAALATNTSVAAASALITTALQNKLSSILSCPAQDIDTSKPMHAHGVDSLVAVELRNWFRKGLRIDVPVFEILGVAGIETLAQSIAVKIRSKKEQTRS